MKENLKNNIFPVLLQLESAFVDFAEAFTETFVFQKERGTQNFHWRRKHDGKR